MPATFQTDLTDTTYNGWTNYETWNVALWINNEEGLYEFARECGDYQTFVNYLYDGYGSTETGDGVKWNDQKVNVIEINSDVFDF
jgi:hypothetical protein